ncbi:MAG: ABC transporter substrate-binding protein [Proteobacteria bacterium]|nr:ABC transporter substrate-binding protein [Pseudomonadota bacterium]MDA1057353.1 ABC transporter substrate-binding protein [Pseudomonadota bacterium]
MSSFKKLLVGAVAAGALFGMSQAGAADMSKTLIVGHSSLPAGLGNPFLDTSHSGGFVFRTAYHLYTTSDKNGPIPELLTSWTVNDADKTKWTFKLRDGVKFHNGNDFTAEDVAQVINWLASPDGIAKAASITRNTRNVASARVIDDHTVEISTKKPDPLLPSTLGVIKVLDWQHLQDVTFEGLGKNPNGTGPYKTVSWTNDGVVVERNDQGWQVGKMDRIEFRFLPELPARVQAFESDQVDLAFQLVADNKAKIEASKGRLQVNPGTAITILHFFSNRPGVPVADVRVRQALNHGINMQQFVDVVMQGTTNVTGQPGTPSINGYFEDIKPYPYDPAKARALLAEAGYGNGLKIIGESVTAQGDWKDIVQFVGDELKKIGVDFEVRAITLPDLIGRVRDTSKFEDATVFSFNYGSEPTMDIMRSINGLHSCNSPMKWTCFPDLQPTIDAANQEFDPAKRRVLLKKIAQTYHDQAASMFLFDSVDLDAVKSYVKDYKPVNRLINWKDVTLDGKRG